MRTIDLGQRDPHERLLLVDFDGAGNEDVERVCDKLTAFTEKQNAPEYAPLRLIFRGAVEGETVVELIVTELWGKMEIDHMYTEESERGHGIGKALLSYIDDYAKASKLTAIRLNTPSWQGEGFYERCGYKEMGRIPLGSVRNGQRDYEITYYKTFEMS